MSLEIEDFDRFWGQTKAQVSDLRGTSAERNWNSIGKPTFRCSQQKQAKQNTDAMKTIKKHIGRGMPSRTVALVGFGTAAAITALLGVTQATPPSKVVSATILARASFVDSVDLKFKIDGAHQEVIQAPQSQDTVMQQIIIGPGGHTGWHSHHGPAVALIKAGALALYPSDDPTCTPRIYLAGQAFVDSGQGHIHLGRNLSLTENVEVWVTYFDVPPGESVRLDAPDPGNCVF